MAENGFDVQKLAGALDELKIINRLLEKVSRIRETNHIMNIIITDLIKYTDADQGVISFVKQTMGEELLTVVRNVKTETSDFPFRLSGNICGWVLKNKKMLKIDNLDSDARFRDAGSADNPFKSIICFPMIIRDEIIGLTSLVKTAEKGPFTDNDCRLTGIITSQTAPILSNARLLEQLAAKNQLLELSQQKLKEENAKLRDELKADFSFENIIFKSSIMKNVLTLVSKFSANDSPVLITGETGTGKELIARAIHFNSDRKNKGFVIKNCGVKTETLLESELFGHTKGAFTGAIADKAGLFKEADGGTIFLDEIGDAPQSTQAAILRVIQTGEIRPIGSSRTDFVNVRIISATNRNLKDLIKDGDFREDLYYRLSTFVIELPPLRERKEDIPPLVSHFLGRLCIKTGRENLSITPAAMEIIMGYSWPGNIRQLENELERACVVCDTDRGIDICDLSEDLIACGGNYTRVSGAKGKLRDIIEKLEKDIISSSLIEHKGNILQTSKALGLTRKGLKDKISRYNISLEI